MTPASLIYSTVENFTASAAEEYQTITPGTDRIYLENLTVESDGMSEGSGWCPNPSMHTSGRRSDISWDDATWILTSSFIIFTMQSGFGLLESGMVSAKNEVNIIVKNAVDVIFGGLSFWMFGFGILFDDMTKPVANKNMFTGVGPFFVDADDENMGYIYSCFIFQLSFSTTATTIVSGAMAERTRLLSYMVFSFINTVIYSFPAYWVWAPSGFLRYLGAVDIAGAGPVHLVGGVTGLVATLLLKPRRWRFEGKNPRPPDMGCPTNALLGMFMLWWGWLGFNTGSTFGISGGKWKLAARSAVATVMASIGGGAAGLLFSFVMKKRKFDISDLVNGILGSLVSITAMCALAHPWEGLVIGSIGGVLAVSSSPLFMKLNVDDPVGVISVHGVAAIWGMVSVGLFVEKDRLECLTHGRKGLLRGGGAYLLGIQLLTCLVIIAWTCITSIILLQFIDITLGLRVTPEEEMLGADLVEHGISHITQPDEPPMPSSRPVLIFSNNLSKDNSPTAGIQTRQTMASPHKPVGNGTNGSNENTRSFETNCFPTLMRARSFSNHLRSPYSSTRTKRPSFRCGVSSNAEHLSLSVANWKSDGIIQHSESRESDLADSVMTVRL